MITVVMANQKGGTGKTTTAVTVAHGLAREGWRVLTVDTDVQGHVSKALGLEKKPGMLQMVRWYQDLEDSLLVVKARENLDVIPSDKSTEPAKQILAGVSFREQVISTALDELAPRYDVAVIDCAPSVDVLHVAALLAGDWLVIPTKLDFLAVDGVNEVLGSLAAISRRSSAPEMLGVLPTFYERTTNETLTQLNELINAFGKKVLPPIPVDTKLREAPAYGETVWEYAPKTRSVVGVSLNGKGGKAGGYVQFLERVKAVL